MKAFILAAGLGSRLGEITSRKPKALVEIQGQTLLGLLINHLKNQGFDQFLVNVHHHGQMVIDYLNENRNFGVQIQISDERKALLDTGGAILKARHFFEGNEPVLIHNVDIISEINFKELLSVHENSKALTTLCVRKRATDRNLIFDNELTLKGWMNRKTNEFKWVEAPFKDYLTYAYSGIYMAAPDFPEHFKRKGAFSIIDAWLAMANTNRINAYLDTSVNWFDLGTKEKLQIAEIYLKS